MTAAEQAALRAVTDLVAEIVPAEQDDMDLLDEALAALNALLEGDSGDVQAGQAP